MRTLLVLCLVMTLLNACSTANKSHQDSSTTANEANASPAASSSESAAIIPEAPSPPDDDDIPPRLQSIPDMPEGMLYIGYYFDNPEGSPDTPKLDEPLRRVPGNEALQTIPAYVHDAQSADHMGPPVNLDEVEMQTAYPMGEAAIIGQYGEQANMKGRRANMSCHTGMASHGATRCCMVPPSTPSGDTPFEERSADMLWAVVCLTNNVMQ